MWPVMATFTHVVETRPLQGEIVRQVYTFLLYLLLPFVLLRLYWNGRHLPAYRKRWPERLGFSLTPTASPSLWVHAVSVGEVLGSAPLIQALLEKYPQHALVITTMTPTGSDRVKELFGDKVQHCYAPYDLPAAIGRFLGAKQPRLLVLFETELWPNMIHACHQQKIPVLLLNARLSSASARGYGRFPRLTQSILQELSAIAAQSPADAKRFIALGADASKVAVTGSVKFDLELKPSLKTEAEQLRAAWTGRPCWIAASTHAGEEEQVLHAFEKIKHTHPKTLLILVPRHPQRFEAVADTIKRFGFQLQRRSQQDHITADCEVLLGDTMGELLKLYACADVAFVGGSLVPHGGHNVLEAAAWARPVLSGPHLFNFQTIADLLLAAGGLVVVQSSETLALEVIRLFDQPELARAMGQHAEQVVNENRGALKKQLELIHNFL